MVTGQKLASKFGNLYIKYGENSQPKIGIALTTKIFKAAHKRNHVKRVVATAFEKLLPQLANNINILVVPNRRVLEVKSEELKKEYESLFN